MDQSTPEVVAELAARYGRVRSRRERSTGRLVAVVGAALAVAVFGWTALNYSSRDTRWQDLSFEVVDPETVDVTFEVYADSGSAVRCVVRAVDADNADVGQVEADITALGDTGARRTVRIRTLREASGASVRTCVLLPDRLQ